MTTQLLTYAELADIWGVSKEAARKKVEGLHLKRQPGNDGRTRVMIDLGEVTHEPAKPRSSVRRPPGDQAETTQNVEDLRRLVSTLEKEVERLASLEAAHRTDYERERDRGDKLATDLSDVRQALVAMTVERDADRARAIQVDMLSAVLEIERQRLTEAQENAGKWREIATAPRGFVSWLRRAV